MLFASCLVYGVVLFCCNVLHIAVNILWTIVHLLVLLKDIKDTIYNKMRIVDLCLHLTTGCFLFDSTSTVRLD